MVKNVMAGIVCGQYWEETGASLFDHRRARVIRLQFMLFHAFHDFFHPGIKPVEQIFTFKVRTWGIVWELATLSRPSCMDCTSATHSVVTEKNAAAVGAGFEGVIFDDIVFSHLTVSDIEMAGETINVNCIDEKGRPFQTVAAVPRAIAAIDCIT